MLALCLVGCHAPGAGGGCARYKANACAFAKAQGLCTNKVVKAICRFSCASLFTQDFKALGRTVAYQALVTALEGRAGSPLEGSQIGSTCRMYCSNAL